MIAAILARIATGLQWALAGLLASGLAFGAGYLWRGGCDCPADVIRDIRNGVANESDNDLSDSISRP